MVAHAVARPPAEDDAFFPAHEQFAAMINHLRSERTRHMTHSELETWLEIAGCNLLLKMFQAHLDERSPGTVATPVIDADGFNHTHQRIRTRSIESIFGRGRLTRAGYGGRGLENLYPLDAELNLPPEFYSHTVRRRVAEAVAAQSYDQVVASFSTRAGATVPKLQCEELTQRAAQDFESFYETRRQATAREVRSTSGILVITTDGKGVPVRQADLREITQKAAKERKPRLKHRRVKGEKAHTKRMGTVAAVYTVAPFVRTPEQIVRELAPIRDTAPARPRPENKRVWASLKQEPEEVIDQAFAEATRRDPQHTKQWVALVDGNETQLGVLLLAAEHYRVELTIILDLIHVVEYLWKAAWAFHGEGDKNGAETWVSERLVEILRGHSSRVAAGMRRSATRRDLDAKKREAIDDCADYLLKYQEFLHYDRYLAAGWPIATGVIEGACRHLVKDRMEITGARWGLDGAEAVLRLRSLRSSGDFDAYWEFHLQQEYERHHASRYANGEVPITNRGAKDQNKISHLKLVK